MRSTVVLLLSSSLALACAPAERDVSLRFEGLVGGEPAQCGDTYSGIGTTSTDLTLADFRLYVSDVRLVTEDGRELPVTLDADDWQTEEVALLDFEDGTAGCESGNAGTNDMVHGRVEDTDASITGVRFQLGVPPELNHLDVSTAEGPLAYTSMFWGWNGGYKFLRVDARTTGMPDGLRIHIGSTGCMGDGRGNISECAQRNQAPVELTGMDPEADHVVVDLAALLSDNDMDSDHGGTAGCQSHFDDPDCEPIFHALGLDFAGSPPTAPQRLFNVASGL